MIKLVKSETPEISCTDAFSSLILEDTLETSVGRFNKGDTREDRLFTSITVCERDKDTLFSLVETFDILRLD